MGGYSYGDIAAKVVVDSILEYCLQNFSNQDCPSLLKDAVSYSNDCLMLKKIGLSAKELGCVVVILLIAGDEAFLAWMGDSRIYMYRNQKEVYRTEDDSLLKELSKVKVLDASILEKYSSIVTKAIMGEENLPSPSLAKVSVEEGDVFLLCSDGFYKDFFVANLAASTDYINEVLEKKALKASDNVSFIRVEI